MGQKRLEERKIHSQTMNYEDDNFIKKKQIWKMQERGLEETKIPSLTTNWIVERTTSLPNNEELTSIRNTPQQCGGPLMHKGCKEFNCRKAACRKRRLIATRFFGSRHDQIWFAPTGWGTLDAFAQGALLIAFAKRCTEFTRRKAACLSLLVQKKTWIAKQRHKNDVQPMLLHKRNFDMEI